jgi:hypothetical protein
VSLEPTREHHVVSDAGGPEVSGEVEHVTATAHPHEQPSDWGWTADFGRPARIAGWISVVGLILMVTSTHYNGAGAASLLITAGLLVLGLLWDMKRRRTSWRG